MSGSPPEIGAARLLVAKAFWVSVDRIGSETKMYDPAIWDSTGSFA
jgi:hypothetical protein